MSYWLGRELSNTDYGDNADTTLVSARLLLSIVSRSATHDNLQEAEREERQKQQLLISRRSHRPDDGQWQQEDEEVGAQLNAKNSKVRMYAVAVCGLDIGIPVRAQGDASCGDEAHARNPRQYDHGHEYSKRFLNPIIGQGTHV